MPKSVKMNVGYEKRLTHCGKHVKHLPLQWRLPSIRLKCSTVPPVHEAKMRTWPSRAWGKNVHSGFIISWLAPMAAGMLPPQARITRHLMACSDSDWHASSTGTNTMTRHFTPQLLHHHKSSASPHYSKSILMSFSLHAHQSTSLYLLLFGFSYFRFLGGRKGNVARRWGSCLHRASPFSHYGF